MSRFDWLKQEIEPVRLKKFHIFLPFDLAELKVFEQEFGPVPDDYQEFLETFGQASLFRDVRNNWHWLNVTAPPKIIRDQSDAVRLNFGNYLNSGYAAWKWADGAFLGANSVYRIDNLPERKVADTFEDWFRTSYFRAIKEIGNDSWRRALHDAPPFNSSEIEIVESLKHFHFRKVGVTNDGNVQIEVANRSSRSLAYLSVGVRFRQLEGKVTIPVAEVGPGETRTVDWPCYKGAVRPEDIQLFRLPFPEPEDRPYYPELRASD